MARIVVLEDDTSTRKLITTLLKKAGHEVTDVDNGAEGLLTVLAELPDLVVSDVEMPKINGFEVLSDIRSTPETALTPVILLTARSSPEDMQYALSQGANDYLIKPFEPEKLMTAINCQLEILAGKLGGDAQRLGAGFEKTAPADLTLVAEASADRASSRSAEWADEPPTEAMELDPRFELSLSERVAKLPRQELGPAWVVSSEVHNAQTLRDAMGLKSWRAFLRQLFLPLSKDMALRNAEYVDLDESRLTLYFLDQPKDGSMGYVRAAHAVQSMLRAGIQTKAWAAAEFPEVKLPVLRVLISLHYGPIGVVRLPLDFGGERDTVVGPTAEFIQRVREGEPRVLWRVLGTAAAVAASPSTYRLGAHAEISVGSQELKVHALQGMNPAWAQGEPLDDSAWI